MSFQGSKTAPILGLFEQRFDGDDALMRLARLRFQQVGMGIEIHGGTPETIDRALSFKPSPDTPVVVHLPRQFNLTDSSARDQIVLLARQQAGKAIGFVIHDHPDLARQPREYQAAARELDTRLSAIPDSPKVFIEYAAGLEPAAFVDFFRGIKSSACLGPGIDIGHLGIRAIRSAYAASRSGEDICSLKSLPSRWPELIDDIEAAKQTALPAALNTICELGRLNLPAHFHLHDGHPLSTFSPYGVSDHLGFLSQIPIPFEHQGRRALAPMFGPAGLAKIKRAALEAFGAARLSFTLEIHPTGEQLDLADAAPFFSHWTDQTNARKTQHWLSLLAQNHALFAGMDRPD
jgi:hypothetical protein